MTTRAYKFLTLIVGEDNPYGFSPRMALLHLPRNAAGNRLREHMGLTDVQYMHLPKINLCPEKWSTKVAREVATVIAQREDIRCVIMLGAKVKKAFGCEHIAFFDCTEPTNNTPIFISLPHPSGRNRIWNEPGARWKARDLLRHRCPDIYVTR